MINEPDRLTGKDPHPPLSRDEQQRGERDERRRAERRETTEGAGERQGDNEDLEALDELQADSESALGPEDEGEGPEAQHPSVTGPQRGGGPVENLGPDHLDEGLEQEAGRPAAGAPEADTDQAPGEGPGRAGVRVDEPGGR